MESSGFALRYFGEGHRCRSFSILSYSRKLCGEWVLSASVGGTGGFSAPTATHLTSGSAHGPQTSLKLVYSFHWQK